MVYSKARAKRGNKVFCKYMEPSEPSQSYLIHSSEQQKIGKITKLLSKYMQYMYLIN